MNRVKFAAALIGLLLCSGVQARADSGIGTFEGSDQSTACVGAGETCRTGTATGKPFVKAQIDWHVSVLVGEPVVDTRLAWKPDNVSGSVNGLVAPIYDTADPDLFYKSAEAAKYLRLYEAKSRLTVIHNRETYTIDSDLGVPDQAGGKMSYNVPASPSWDRLFRDQNGAFIPADKAREIIGSGSMAGATASLVSAKVDTSKFEEWWLDKNVERYAAPLRSAIDGRLAALEVSFGLPTDALRAEIAALEGGTKARALIARLEGILQKLAPDRIPAKFLGEGPQKMARLHAYGLSIASSEDGLRNATKHLPPMPGASKAYETWYDQVAVRMNNDAARLAHLRGLKAEAERAEYEAAVAAQRVKVRAERLAADKKNIANAKERARRRNAAAPQKSFSEEFGYAEDDAHAGDSGFGATGWNAGGGTQCGYGTYDIGNGQCSYFFGSDSSGAGGGGNYGCDSELAAVLAHQKSHQKYESSSEGEASARARATELGSAWQDCMTRNANE